MKLLLAIAGALLWAYVANAEPAPVQIPTCTVAELAAGTCAPAREGNRVHITNGDFGVDANCSSGTGSIDQICEYDGSAWVSAPAITENNIDATDLAAAVDTVILCGENDENGTIYFGPATGPFLGDGSDISMTSAGCDALDNATEATADAPLYTGAPPFKVMGMVCRTDATLGAAESIVFTLRSAAASLTPSITCTIGVGVTECQATDPALVDNATTTDIAEGATLAVRVVEASDNADGDESWCKVFIAFK